MDARHRRADAANPFSTQRLAGADCGPTRYPASFALHDEGGLYGLYLSPATLGWLGEVLQIPDGDRALVVEGRLGRGPGTTLPWTALDLLHCDVDIVHLPADSAPEAAVLDLPVPLLARPDEAVPEQVGSRVAISLHDGCHAVVLTREDELVSLCVRAFFDAYVASATGRDRVEVPDLSDELLSSLLDPVPDDEWRTLHLDMHQRFWTLDIHSSSETAPSECIRWVAEGPGGRWRSGWAW